MLRIQVRRQELGTCRHDVLPQPARQRQRQRQRQTSGTQFRPLDQLSSLYSRTIDPQTTGVQCQSVASAPVGCLLDLVAPVHRRLSHPARVAVGAQRDAIAHNKLRPHEVHLWTTSAANSAVSLRQLRRKHCRRARQRQNSGSAQDDPCGHVRLRPLRLTEGEDRAVRN